jgi:hypothetical protein
MANRGLHRSGARLVRLGGSSRLIPWSVLCGRTARQQGGYVTMPVSKPIVGKSISVTFRIASPGATSGYQTEEDNTCSTPAGFHFFIEQRATSTSRANRRIAGGRTTLRSADASIVETAFASRLAELTSSGSAEVPLPSSQVSGHFFRFTPSPLRAMKSSRRPNLLQIK